MTNRRYRRKGVGDEQERAKNPTMLSVRAKLEHPFQVIERVFGFAKTRYRGLDKNANRQFVTWALTNLSLVRRCMSRVT
jgi:IS5 family transposase